MSTVVVNVKTLTGKTHRCTVFLDEPTAILKLDLQQKEGIPAAQQRLVFAGKILEDERKASEYNLANDYTLHLVLRLRSKEQDQQQWNQWSTRFAELQQLTAKLTPVFPLSIFPIPRDRKLNFKTNQAKRVGKRTTKRRPANSRTASYNIYIYKILKQVHPDSNISNQAVRIMDDFVKDILSRIVREAEQLCEMLQKRVLTSREIQTGVRLQLPGELAKHAVSEGTKAVTKFTASKDDRSSRSARSSQSSRAGVVFPVSRVKSHMKEIFHLNLNISLFAPVYLAAVLEYLCAEVLELSGRAARDNKKIRVIPRHLMLAIRNDEELHKLTSKCIISGGGVIPNIFSPLFPKRKEERKEGGLTF